MSLARWAARSPRPPSPAPIRSADSVILALRARFDPHAGHGLRAGYKLRLGEDRFRIEVAHDRLEIARGDGDQADATIDTDTDTIAAVLWGGRSLADVQRSGTMTIEGDKAAVERFVALFPMPEPAAAASPA
jgi:alkyl sulfatase BDS1-like metallo-beta-lactamase superfamily hydrolase